MTAATTQYSPKQIRKALRKTGTPAELRLCHEAGQCGCGLARELHDLGFACDVIAPARVARQPADNIKTNRRDAILLARLLSANNMDFTS